LYLLLLNPKGRPSHFLITKITEEVKTYNRNGDVLGDLGRICKTVEKVRLNVKTDQRHYSFKLYKIEISYGLLQSVGAGVSTVLAYAINRFMQ
jgi:hypothetical protein